MEETIHIQEKINRYYKPIESSVSGGPNTRYKSWEWCHKAFLKEKRKREKGQDPDYDLLSLHLAFYLASWGMYRGSTFLLQRDYKAHERVVKEVLDPRYEPLWDFDPSKGDANIVEANHLLFDDAEGIYWKIRESYQCSNDDIPDIEESDIGGDDATDTLVTKILMGTFACIPAFDRFLKKGIGTYNAALKGMSKKNNNDGDKGDKPKKLTQAIVKTTKKVNSNGTEEETLTGTDSFMALAELVKTNPDEFKLKKSNGKVNTLYPPMKCVDMYFWQIGFEMELAKALTDSKKSIDVRKKLCDKAVKMELIEDESNKEELKNFSNFKNDKDKVTDFFEKVKGEIEERNRRPNSEKNKASRGETAKP